MTVWSLLKDPCLHPIQLLFRQEVWNQTYSQSYGQGFSAQRSQTVVVQVHVGVFQVAEEGLDRNGLRVVTGLQVELHTGQSWFLIVVFRNKEEEEDRKKGKGGGGVYIYGDWALLVTITYCLVPHQCHTLNVCSQEEERLQLGPRSAAPRPLPAQGSSCSGWADRQTSRRPVSAPPVPEQHLHEALRMHWGQWAQKPVTQVVLSAPSQYILNTFKASYCTSKSTSPN